MTSIIHDLTRIVRFSSPKRTVRRSMNSLEVDGSRDEQSMRKIKYNAMMSRYRVKGPNGISLCVELVDLVVLIRLYG